MLHLSVFKKCFVANLSLLHPAPYSPFTLTIFLLHNVITFGLSSAENSSFLRPLWTLMHIDDL